VARESYEKHAQVKGRASGVSVQAVVGLRGWNNAYLWQPYQLFFYKTLYDLRSAVVFFGL